MLVVLEDVLGAVAVVHVEVDDRHALEAMHLDRMARGDRDVVEDAEAHRPRAASMVARRPHRAERRGRFFRDHEVGGHDAGAGGAQRGVQRVAIHRGIGIEVHRAFFRRHLADGAHVFQRMHARELLVGGERCLVGFHVRGDTRGDQLIVDRGEARGLLGMLRAHVMPEAIGMRDKSGRHDGRSYPIE